MAESSFTLSVSETALNLLSQKLALTRLPDESAAFDDWSYGVPLSDVKRLLHRWKNGYDWRAAEAKLNEDLPMFTREDIEVEGFGTFKTHYVHKKSERRGAIPLLFLHGWPGHFGEVRKILPLLTNPDSNDQPAFHVVAPSLPGSGFTSSPKTPGFGLNHHAKFAHNLMVALGYNKYVIQGGDWGHAIAQRMVHMYADAHIKAWHTNIIRCGPPSYWYSPFKFLKFLVTPFTEAEKKGLERTQHFSSEGFGYIAIQSTKPHTLGISLDDSPVGLLAWIYEKLVGWSDEYPWSDDEVLTWVSIHYHSLSGPAAAIRIYCEASRAGDFFVDSNTLWKSIPMGYSHFPKELFIVPTSWACNVGNLVYMCEHPKGGHFASYEQPDALVGDLRKMFQRGGVAHGVIVGCEGY